MSDQLQHILEPVRFFASARLLSGEGRDLLPADVEVTSDLDRAMALENSQNMPEGYRIWADAIEEAVSDFYATEEGQQGRTVIEPEADAAWTSRGEFQRALNKKKIRKTITPFEEFWATVAYSILENLQYVSLGRFVKGESGEPFLERLFQIYICGLYPCGLHDDGRIVALDPASLAGFEKLPEGDLSR